MFKHSIKIIKTHTTAKADIKKYGKAVVAAMFEFIKLDDKASFEGITAVLCQGNRREWYYVLCILSKRKYVG